VQWLLLALGLAGVAGWLAVRLHRRREQAQAYLKGVRSMISDDPDAAIEALSDAARLGSPEAVETYLALGALLRRTGDLPRALRLHRNMLHGPGLDPARRVEVERELAEDYRRAGMLDEAADAYRRLAGQGDGVAAGGLRDVLLEQGRLDEALEWHRARCAEDRRLEAHLLAAQARVRLPGDPAGALERARAAAATDPGCADALVTLAQAEAAGGDGDAAVVSVARALRSDPADALLAWPALEAMPSGPALGVVEEVLAGRRDDARLHLLRGRLLAGTGRHHEAVEAIRDAMDLDGDGEVTYALREVLREAPAPAPEELPARHDLMVAALLRTVRPLRCRRCGAGSATRAWRCPRCGAFDAYP
jgi:lipopolysaccharide biosynthesis regulator YciM